MTFQQFWTRKFSKVYIVVTTASRDGNADLHVRYHAVDGAREEYIERTCGIRDGLGPEDWRR